MSLPNLSHRRPPEPSTMVIFGASGDLTHRKLIPALYSLHSKGRLPQDFNIVGYARTPFSHDDFRDNLRLAVAEYSPSAFQSDRWEAFAQHIFYCPGDAKKPEDFFTLEKSLRQLRAGGDGAGNRVYYLAVAPQFYEDILRGLGEHGMASQEGGWRRIVIEKPFGYDLTSAEALNRTIHTVFAEEQIYRIDHYLGKETAQNILFLRFANTIFEPVWNRTYVDHVQITVAEKVDVGHRAVFYEQAGVLRDIFQNHLMQLLALTTMEPPASFNADLLRNETVKVLAAIRPISPEEVALHTVRGQYEGYHNEPGVAATSTTATYAAIRLFIDNWRWQGVPFFLRSGKALAEKTTEIIVQFKRPPHVLFPLLPDQQITPNQLAIHIQPDEGIELRFEAKVPDTIAEMCSVKADFNYADHFGSSGIPDAYERLLLDVLLGDAALFIRSDAIRLSWAFTDSILEGWESPQASPLAPYPKGSWGPAEADELLNQDGRCLLHGCD